MKKDHLRLTCIVKNAFAWAQYCHNASSDAGWQISYRQRFDMKISLSLAPYDRLILLKGKKSCKQKELHYFETMEKLFLHELTIL